MRDGTLKRVAIHKGTAIQICIVPKELSPTLSNWDEGLHRAKGRGCIFLGTGRDGSALSLEAQYLRDHPIDEIPVYNVNRRVGVGSYNPISYTEILRILEESESE